MVTDLPFAWSHGCGLVSTTAGMLRSCVFELEGVAFDPFARATWAPNAFPQLPGHLRTLGAEFVCLPFGGDPVAGVSAGWEGARAAQPVVPAHGRPADEEWEIVAQGPGGVSLAPMFPDDEPIQRLERRIAGVPGEPAVALSVSITARRATVTSLGLHPILRLPEQPRSLRLQVGFEAGFTYPVIADDLRPQATAGRRFAALERVPMGDAHEDLSRLPLDRPAEEIVQLAGVTGPVTAFFEQERAGVVIDWDRRRLPCVQLWLSDRALGGDPWRQGYRGLGVEPVASAFDLPVGVSIAQNPISQAGYPTSVALGAGETVTIGYSIHAFSQK
mgnify:FL=1